MCGGKGIGSFLGPALAIGGTLLAPELAPALGITGGLGTGLLGAGLAGAGDVVGSAVTGQPISPLGVGLSAAGGGIGAGLGAGGVAPAAGASSAVGPAAGAGTSLADLSGPVEIGGSTGIAAASESPLLSAAPAITSVGSTLTGPIERAAIPSLAPAAAPISPAAVAPALTPGISPSIAPAVAPAAGPQSANDVAAKVLASGGATGTAGGASSPSGIGGALDALTAFTKAHPYLTLGGGLIGSQLLSPELSKLTGSGLTSEEKALLNQAQGASSGANQLISSLNTGVLPPGAEASVDQALQADIANIKSRYASMGMSGSSSEQQDIANAQQTAAANKFSLAQSAAQTGLNEVGVTQNAYSTLIKDQLNRQQQLQNAFSGFFNALGVGTALGQAKAA